MPRAAVCRVAVERHHPPPGERQQAAAGQLGCVACGAHPLREPPRRPEARTHGEHGGRRRLGEGRARVGRRPRVGALHGQPGGADGGQRRRDGGGDLRPREHEHRGSAALGREGQAGKVGELAGAVDDLAVAERRRHRGIRGEPHARCAHRAGRARPPPRDPARAGGCRAAPPPPCPRRGRPPDRTSRRRCSPTPTSARDAASVAAAGPPAAVGSSVPACSGVPGMTSCRRSRPSSSGAARPAPATARRPRRPSRCTRPGPRPRRPRRRRPRRCAGRCAGGGGCSWCDQA